MLPRATYRLQLGPSLDFAGAAALAPYLAGLGVSHVYLSPHLQAASGSTHGYDVVDHGRVSDALGGEVEHHRMLTVFARHGLSVVIDVVPNHMAIANASANAWWWDVLANGRESRWAEFFDIDWDHPDERLRNRVLVPVLGDHYGRVLDAGEITVARDDGRIVVRAHDHIFPLNARSIAQLPDDLTAVNADKERLHALLEQQSYRLAYWRSARYDLDYRRFFDVSDLVGLRMELSHVFEATHALPLRWVNEGLVTGLRVDHPDGLIDPVGYLQHLRERAPHCWILVEKILAWDERLPITWPVDGTTGYDFANRVCGLWIDGRSARAFSDMYREVTGAADASFAPVAVAKKRRIMRDVLGADIRRVVELFFKECETNLSYRDTSREELRRVVENLLVALPVYRTYVRKGEAPSEHDRRVIANMVAKAKARCADCDGRLFDFLETLLLTPTEATLRFQQVSGPVTAKGVEDTAFFDHHRFIALNDVGNDPDVFGVSAVDVHAHNLAKHRDSPRAMLATSTHDSKRSEDVRARLAVLTEIPEEWRAWVMRVRRLIDRYRDHNVGAGIVYHLCQTLVGAWPIDEERVALYLEKAMREAKDKTSWMNVNASYEGLVQDFAMRMLRDGEVRRELDVLCGRIGAAGEQNALAQKLLTLTSPGVPDLYQGSERWFFALTDPDNRRAVDHELPDDAKTDLVRKALAVRRRHPACFDERGTYTPMFTDEPRIVAYRRGEHVLVIVQRLRLTAFEASLCLPEGTWNDALAGERYSGVVPWRSSPAMLLVRAS